MMSKTIWKFELPWLSSSFPLVIPKDAKVRHLGAQLSGGDYTLCLWAELTPTDEPQTRRYAVVRTGDDVPKESVYIGTAQSPGYVAHVYELDGAYACWVCKERFGSMLRLRLHSEREHPERYTIESTSDGS